MKVANLFTVLGTVLMLGFHSPATPVTLVTTLPISVVVPVTAASECELECREDSCPEGYHDAYVQPISEPEWMRNGGEHITQPTCRSGTCDTTHGPQCVEFLASADFEVMRAALAHADLQGLRRAIAASEGFVVLNEYRAALQVLNCIGAVVAHIPVRESVLSGLVAAAD